MRGHLACSSHKPLTSSYSPITKRLQAGQDQGFRIVYLAKYYFANFPLYIQSKLLENHTLHSGTYLYSPYKAVPPPPGCFLSFAEPSYIISLGISVK